jgi:hypothetical protein
MQVAAWKGRLRRESMTRALHHHVRLKFRVTYKLFAPRAGTGGSLCQWPIRVFKFGPHLIRKEDRIRRSIETTMTLALHSDATNDA